MKTIYKGFELEAKREKALGGWEQVYFTSKRKSDGWFLADSFSDDEDNLETHIQCLKDEVDEFLENPRDFLDPDTYEDQLIQERDEARVLAAWFFQDCVAPYGMKKDVVKQLRKRYSWLKVPVQQPILDHCLRPVED